MGNRHLEIGCGGEGQCDNREETRGVAPGEIVVVRIQEVVPAPTVSGENLMGLNCDNYHPKYNYLEIPVKL